MVLTLCLLDYRNAGNESPTSQTGSLTSKDPQDRSKKITPIVFAPPHGKPNPRGGASRGRRGGGRGGR